VLDWLAQLGLEVVAHAGELVLEVGSIAWSLGIVAVFAPLAVRRYRRAA
jgi:hypothetical protein